MQQTDKLQTAVEAALLYLSMLPEVQEAEVFAASNRQCVLRLNYTSHLLCNGVEEPKSTENFGIGIRAVFKTDEGLKVGSGSEANDLTIEGIKKALGKARDGAVLDSEFTGFARPLEGEKRTLYNYHDPLVMELSEKAFVDAGWKILDGAIKKFDSSVLLMGLASAKNKKIGDLGLIIGGDLTLISERIAVASTNMPEVQTDESTVMTTAITAMVEAFDAKGSGYGEYRRLDEINDKAGADAAQNAIDACGLVADAKAFEIAPPVSVPSGTYTVIFGPQPVCDMFNNLVMGGLTTASFFGCGSPFMGKMGQRIASEKLSVVDDAANPQFPGAKGITCEGLPTRRVELIKNGVLNDLLSDWYETERITHKDPEATDKLGVSPELLRREGKLLPTSGFRFAEGGGRAYDGSPGIAGTNTLIQGTDPKPLNELISRVENGILIGKIWYCYPVNGFRQGDFTATVVADSFVIKNGKIVAPLKANAIRLNDNILRVLNAVEDVSDEKKSCVLWAADEMTIAASMLVTGVRVEEIGSGAQL